VRYTVVVGPRLGPEYGRIRTRMSS
jgi:hypothetical protein